jgi:hypothetical protein
MIEEYYYQDAGHVKITAASVGISKLRWVDIKTDDESDAYNLMKEERFDHLPITDENGQVSDYFKTESPNNFENIKKHEITYRDIIPLDTDIREVIRKFVSLNRTYFFLTFQKRISGLITIGNLNCRQVQVYLFSLICDLERELGDLVNREISNYDVIKYIERKKENDTKEQKYSKMLNNYKNLMTQDLENKMTEHFFFIDFFNIIMDNNLFDRLGFTKKSWKDYSSINELRIRVAHPTKSLLDKKNTIDQLARRLDKIDDLLFRLNQTGTTYKTHAHKDK